MRKKSFITVFVILVFLALIGPRSSFAQGIRCGVGNEINTALGCIPFHDPTQISRFALTWAMGVGGGIALILIVLAGFIITTSSGNPQKLSAGKELLTAAISGLLLIIFSAFILRLIGVDILGIPGFG